MSLQMQFNPSTVLPNEQPEIKRVCEIAWKNYQVLHSSNQATVYSSQGKWWHKNDNDTRDHVTVRYNRRPGGNRVHIYRDGTGNMSPNKPSGMKPKGAPEATEGNGVVYDSVSELSDEEWP